MRTRPIAVSIAILTAALGATALGRYVRSARVLHPRSGQPILVPGRDGASTLLFNGSRITPAGRHLGTGAPPPRYAAAPDVLADWHGHQHLVVPAGSATTARAHLGAHPVTCRLSGDGKTLFVALWGGPERVAVDVRTPAAPAIVAHLPT